MKILVWQWGRFGGAPQNCVDWAAGFNTVPGYSSVFSLSRQAEFSELARMLGLWMIFMDPPEHTRLRRIVARLIPLVERLLAEVRAS